MIGVSDDDGKLYDTLYVCCEHGMRAEALIQTRKGSIFQKRKHISSITVCFGLQSDGGFESQG